ncbi:carbohydrate ABC transporter permease [Salinisphaera sp. RV14]|uniref:carbohydrate ABC transporter permease n=1 Tax=unclassified Salinisphaera TaxID=2649847 RepID=UPI003F83CBA7
MASSRRMARHSSRIGRYLLLACWAFFCLLPILWLVTISLRGRTETMVNPPIYWPHFTLDAWRDTFDNWPMWAYLRNTFVAAIGSVLLDLLLAIPAAYSLARFQYRGRDQIGFYILSTRMIVPAAVALPIYILFKNIHLLDNPVALMLIYAAINLSIVTWVIRSYMIEVPREIEEAARVDGAHSIGILLRITLPLSISGVVTASILALIFAVNEFLFTLLISYTEKAQTLSVGLAMFTGGSKGIIYNDIAVVALVTFVPMFILTLLIQRHLSRGLTMGALKN